MLQEFFHFAIGNALIGSDRADKNQVRYLTLQNGLYDLDKEILVPHTPKIFTTNLLPYNYDPQAQCPRFEQYLQEIFYHDEGRINFTQEATGYAFHKSIPMPAIFFLIGEGSNGKSVFLNILVSLFGERNCSSISLNSLSNEYYLLDLFGKMINVSSETPHKKQINTDVIKAAVAGDWVTGREPYKHPVKFRPYAKHYLAMNETPFIADGTHGMWRRIYVIEFPRIFSEEEMDVALPQKLLQELPGIFNWALAGYKRLRQNNFNFTEGSSLKQAKKKFKVEADSIQAFVHGKLEEAPPSQRIRLGEIYESYRSFCQSEGYKNQEKKNNLKKVLKELKYEIDNSTTDSNQLTVYGVRFIE